MMIGILLKDITHFFDSHSDATHAITPDQKENPIDVLAGDIFFTYVAHD
tara:strand:- start:559 stop:705 length:147 start_codon:yes stop_codon:yes gene_type:complete